MIDARLALVCVGLPAALSLLVFVASLVGRRLSDGDFSWGRYVAWLGGAAVLAVLLVASRTTTVFLGVASALVCWVLFRAAADAQVTTVREKIGFLQLYGGLLLVESLALLRVGALAGTRASASFGISLHERLAGLVVPVLSVFPPPSRGLEWARPETLAGALAETLSANLLATVALATFGLAAFVYAHFAEHATPQIGLSLLPFPTPVALAVAGLVVVARGLAGSLPGAVAEDIALFVAPYFVAEGLWVVRRLASRLRTRNGWTAVLALASIPLPGLAHALGVVGWAFHLIRLRSFQPILGDVERSGSRPRLRSALLAGALSAVSVSAAGALGNHTLRAGSPGFDAGPEGCSQVTFTVSGTRVAVASPARSFTIDADETRASASSAGALSEVCARRGERLCTSDEWSLACVCSYPNESEGGTKLGPNPRLSYRVEIDRKEPTGRALSEVHGLLDGAAELVAARGAPAAVVAGPSDAMDDPYAVDCRARAFLPESAFDLATSSGAVAVRCCK